MTHYIGCFTQTLRGLTSLRQRAVCGVYVDRGEHTTEPTCPACLAYLQKEADDEPAIADALGLELKDGIWLDKGRA